jgi:hypothetical protein
MLAQNFKTPADLMISNELHRTLITVLGMLERDELKHTIVNEGFADVDPRNGTIGLFNMAWWGVADDNCGTVMCIGGTCEAILRRQLTHAEDGTQWCHSLFYPAVRNMDAVTVAQAAQATRNYLTDGDPRWHEIVRN